MVERNWVARKRGSPSFEIELGVNSLESLNERKPLNESMPMSRMYPWSSMLETAAVKVYSRDRTKRQATCTPSIECDCAESGGTHEALLQVNLSDSLVDHLRIQRQLNPPTALFVLIPWLPPLQPSRVALPDPEQRTHSRPHELPDLEQRL
jgi:hypothetical protein